MENIKEIKFDLAKGFKFTGREISSKLVISKNQTPDGNSVTIVMKRFGSKYFFIPITDIYLDYKKTQLIMPKYEPVFVTDALYRDIIPSKKYKECYVFAKDSDIEKIFKEIVFPNKQTYWCLVFDKIILHKHFLEIDYETEDEKYGYFTTYQLNNIKKEEDRIEREEASANFKECEELTNELLEEAGYDFLD